MIEPLRFGLLGLGTGSVYALIALGLVLVYRGSGTVNFAQGAVGMVAAFTFYDLRDALGLPWPVLAVLAIGVSAAIGAAWQLLVMRRLAGASGMTRLVATLGLLGALVAAEERHGDAIRLVTSPLPHGSLQVLPGLSVAGDRVIIFGVALAITVVLSIIYSRTRFGLATSAVAENPRGAAALGWSPEMLAAANWAAGGAVAGVACLLAAPVVGLQAQQLTFLVLPALAAALIGGFRSFWLTFAGALGLGVAEAELSRYAGGLGGGGSLPFFAVIVVLSIRGRSLPLRGTLADRMPRVPRTRPRPWVAAAVIAVSAVWLLGAPPSAGWLDAITTTALVGLVALSIVLVTGFAGQISLAQFAFAGVGAWIAGRLVAGLGVPLGPAAIVGVLVAATTGFLVGLPSLRNRGVVLAVVTLGLGEVLEQVVFANEKLTGGIGGTTIGTPSILGWDVGSIVYPQRYAFLAIVAFVFVGLGLANLRTGHSGRRLMAVRANERAAAALGVDVPEAKLYAFTLAAAIAGLAGVLMAYRFPHVNYDGYTVLASIDGLVLTVVGGIGYVLGAVIAAIGTSGGLVAQLLGNGGDVDRWLRLGGGVVVVIAVLIGADGMARHNIEVAQRLVGWLPRWRPPSRRAAIGDRQGVQNLATGATPAQGTVPPLALEAQGVTVRFGGVTAVEDASVVVDPGRVVGIIGPNGAGKTTLLDAINGFVPLGAGTVRIGGRAAPRTPTACARAGMSRGFQSLELFEDLTLAENLLVACDDHGRRWYVTDLARPSRPALSPAAHAAIDVFGLGDRLERLPASLSYGERRLFSVARALATGASVLLLDEPAAGLDTAGRRALGALVRRLADEHGIAVLLVEHDVELVWGVCDHVVALNFGRVIASGPPSDVRRDPSVVTAFLGTPISPPERPGGPTPSPISQTP